MNIKLNPRKYYKTIENCHGTGDIWKDLPTMGLLKQQRCSGLIVTPGCDLANAKVETITYLPVISIKNFLSSRSFYYEVRSQFNNLVKERVPNINDYLLKNKLPNLEDLIVLEEIISEACSNEKASFFEKIKHGIVVMKIICDPEEKAVSLDNYKYYFGERVFKNICIGIIRNSYSNDLHFLPKDQYEVEWSSVYEHSVVLFRYPITIPIEVLDLANNTELVNWDGGVRAIASMYPVANQFIGVRPLKSISLNIEFLSDLLTRFCGLYMRIGSPDFTHNTIHEIANEI